MVLDGALDAGPARLERQALVHTDAYLRGVERRITRTSGSIVNNTTALTLGASSVTSLTVTTDSFNSVSGVAMSLGLSIRPKTNGYGVNLGGNGGNAGVLDISNAILAGFTGYNGLTVGATGAGAVYSGALTTGGTPIVMPASTNLTLRSGTGYSITVSDAITL